jgi:hypothetical protein
MELEHTQLLQGFKDLKDDYNPKLITMLVEKKTN